MAEEKRSINIAYKADLKDLINKLKQMPNVTEQEAKKMVSALDRQLKQAEKAAKKSADASAKA
jgi:recombinational DNA repair protein RecR